MFYATVKKDHLLITDDSDKRFPMELKTKEDFVKFAILWEEKGHLMCSSDLDWPEDITEESDLILMCDLIRGNNVSGRNPNYMEQH